MTDVPLKTEQKFPLLQLPTVIFEQLLKLLDPMSLTNLSILSKRSNYIVLNNLKRPFPIILSLRSPDYLQLQSPAYPGEYYIWKFYKSKGTENFPTVFVNGTPIKQKTSHQLEGPKVTYIHSLYFDRFEFSLKQWTENLIKVFGAPIDSVYLDLSPSIELGMNIWNWLKTVQGNYAKVVGVEGYCYNLDTFRKHL